MPLLRRVGRNVEGWRFDAQGEPRLAEPLDKDRGGDSDETATPTMLRTIPIGGAILARQKHAEVEQCVKILEPVSSPNHRTTLRAGHKTLHRLGNAPAAPQPIRAANSALNRHSRADGVHTNIEETVWMPPYRPEQIAVRRPFVAECSARPVNQGGRVKTDGRGYPEMPDDDLKSRIANFRQSYLDTPKGREHYQKEVAEEREVSEIYAALALKSAGGSDVTDEVLKRLLPYANTPAIANAETELALGRALPRTSRCGSRAQDGRMLRNGGYGSLAA